MFKTDIKLIFKTTFTKNLPDISNHKSHNKGDVYFLYTLHFFPFLTWIQDYGGHFRQDLLLFGNKKHSC